MPAFFVAPQTRSRSWLEKGCGVSAERVAGDLPFPGPGALTSAPDGACPELFRAGQWLQGRLSPGGEAQPVAGPGTGGGRFLFSPANRICWKTLRGALQTSNS